MNRLLPVMLLSFALWLPAGQAVAQVQLTTQKPDKFKYGNSVQIEAFGPGAIYSLNYERNVINLAHVKTSFQVGGSYLPPSTGLITLSFPIRIVQLFSFRQHHIESGLGYSFTFSDGSSGHLSLRDYNYEPFITFTLGYRYQKPEGRWLFKMLFTPVLEYENHREFTPWGALTLGYNF